MLKMNTIDYSKLHEKEEVVLSLADPIEVTSANSILTKLGGSNIDDFLTFDRSDAIQPWQAQSYATVTFAKNKEELGYHFDHPSQEEVPLCDKLIFTCLFSYIPKSQIREFLDLIRVTQDRFDAIITHKDNLVSHHSLVAIFESYFMDIKTELAEIPGNEFLAITIAESYPRKKMHNKAQ